MKNLDAHFDGLMHAFNNAYEEEPPWMVVCNDDGADGFLVIDDTGTDDGNVYETEEEAQDVANQLNKEAMEAGDDDFYIE
jgi:hypothetical protein